MHALRLARACSDLPYFPHILELTLHEVRVMLARTGSACLHLCVCVRVFVDAGVWMCEVRACTYACACVSLWMRGCGCVPLRVLYGSVCTCERVYVRVRA